MKRCFTFLVVLAVMVAGAGFYRGWFTVASEHDAESRKIGVRLTVDPVKVKEDAEMLKDKTKTLKEQVIE